MFFISLLFLLALLSQMLIRGNFNSGRLSVVHRPCRCRCRRHRNLFTILLSSPEALIYIKANFNQTWNKTYVGNGNSNMFK